MDCCIMQAGSAGIPGGGGDVVRIVSRLATVVLLVSGMTAIAAADPAAASQSTVPNTFPHTAVAGFSTPLNGFAVVYADGSVRPAPAGDASALALNQPMTGGTGSSLGGYWLVGADGGVFSFGAHFYGSMGATPLNQPVFSMAATANRAGYWLVARDGGIFSFGNARFFGSAANVPLRQPIAGMLASGAGYRLVARDGGIFDYGDAAFFGSLPSVGVHVSDVVGMARTPSGRGYWIARSTGQVYAFGDAAFFGNAPLSSCDAVTAIIANPQAQGYRLVRPSGATIAFGNAPGGSGTTGTPRRCGQVTVRIELPNSSLIAGRSMTGHLVFDNDTGAPVSFTEGGCATQWVVGLGNAQIPNNPIVPAICLLHPSPVPVGVSQIPFVLSATYVTCTAPCDGVQPLPPGTYFATLIHEAGLPPFVAPVPVAVLAG
jgi:hypothetical protein